jgi:hypothetical protein
MFGNIATISLQTYQIASIAATLYKAVSLEAATSCYCSYTATKLHSYTAPTGLSSCDECHQDPR